MGFGKFRQILALGTEKTLLLFLVVEVEVEKS
jgi:hypothetical protein